MTRLAFLLGLLSGAALAQSPASPAVFEVADVHPSQPGTKDDGVYSYHGRFEMHGVTLLRAVVAAYDVPADRVFGGPNWLDSDRFDIVAQTSPSITGLAARPMLRALLAERFQLAVHNDDKPELIYALLPGKRAELKETAGTGEPECKSGREDTYFTATCQNITMEALAQRLPGMAPAYFDHPVVDRTGLRGAYDFTLKWTGRGQIGARGSEQASISLFDSLEKQLGIRAEPATRPAAALVIDGANRPTPNRPDIDSKFRPDVAEFEVGLVRPSKPGVPARPNISNGRFEVFGETLKNLIVRAYAVDGYMVTGGENWVYSDHFDVIAKAGEPVSYVVLRAMLRKLLADQFHLTLHKEPQPVTVYALTARKAKPQLKPAAGEDRSECTRLPGNGAFTLTCRNTTMAQLVERLPGVPGAAGYFDHPVVDQTGLIGAFDFDITWSPPARVNASRPVGDAQAASEPSNALTIFDAVDKQLGLKLSLTKAPVEVIVIDRAEQVE